jgi:hypothetical protein
MCYCARIAREELVSLSKEQCCGGQVGRSMVASHAARLNSSEHAPHVLDLQQRGERLVLTTTTIVQRFNVG